ncbi:hypothetical protein ACHAWX_000894 [Stephanocyclus meneghinianus]
MSCFRHSIITTKEILSKSKGLFARHARSDIGSFRRYTAAQITSNDELSQIVEQFPPQIDYAFGYGSAVLHQQNSNPSSSMVDIIMSVPDPYKWHTENLLRHPGHYSMISRLGGPSFVTWLQCNFGAKLYFHPYVDLPISSSSDKRQIKYGVVSTSDLIRDLRQWDYLYLAGRMHKPIVSISLPSDSKSAKERKEEKSYDMAMHGRKDDIDSAQRGNLLAAVSTSLLLIGGESGHSNNSSMIVLPISKLYSTIASLSYTGDFRMQTGAEDPDKVTKLVETPGMLHLWEAMYADTLKKLQGLGLLSVATTRGNSNAKTRIEYDPTDTATRKQLMSHLPPRLHNHSDQIIGSDGASCIQNGSFALRRELTRIVAPAARSQGLKGMVTAGLAKSLKYAQAKFAKGRLKK